MSIIATDIAKIKKIKSSKSRQLLIYLVGHKCGYGAPDLVVFLVVGGWTQQYKNEPGRHRDLRDVTKERRFLQANESVQRIRQTLGVADQYVGSFGACRDLLEEVLVVLHTSDS